MCFEKTSNRQKPKKATKPILAFKRLRINGAELESPQYRHVWKMREVVKVKMQESLYRETEVEAGLHCYIKKEFADKNWSGINIFTVPVLIPKGATYYKNKNEIVSNRMILLDDNVKGIETIKFLIGQK